jgi:hypothetical protein
MAVAPDSSLAKRAINLFMCLISFFNAQAVEMEDQATSGLLAPDTGINLAGLA